jgi:hypothetical protein
MIAAAVGLGAAQLGAGAIEVPFDRGIEEACDVQAQDPGQFVDVALGDAHAGAVGCLSAYGVVQGKFVNGGNVYVPTAHVTRQQMATFVALALDRLPERVYALPAAGGSPDFTDAASISPAHRANVDRLRRAGIVAGYADGSFGPGELIDRAQMASFIARAIEEATSETLERADVFDDVRGEHRPSVEKLTAAGVVQGTSKSSYAPSTPTTRAQMATMIARSLDLFVAAGHLQPVASARGTATPSLVITDVTISAHDGFDRVTFALDDDAPAGWNVLDVDEALAHGSGQAVEVDGDGILEVFLTGMALPSDSDETPSETGRVELGGAGVVEVLDQGVYERRHQFFIGTTGPVSFTVERESEPQRIHLDVEHGS